MWVGVLVCMCAQSFECVCVGVCVYVFVCMHAHVFVHVPVCAYEVVQEWEERGFQLDVFISLNDPVTQERPPLYILGARRRQAQIGGGRPVIMVHHLWVDGIWVRPLAQTDRIVLSFICCKAFTCYLPSPSLSFPTCEAGITEQHTP